MPGCESAIGLATVFEAGAVKDAEGGFGMVVVI